jgi:hypothetical protein
LFNNSRNDIIPEWDGVVDAKAVLFKRLYAVKPGTFHNMLLILKKEFDTLHKNGGKPPKLTPEDKRYVTLKYLREYRTYLFAVMFPRVRLGHKTRAGR